MPEWRRSVSPDRRPRRHRPRRGADHRAPEGRAGRPGNETPSPGPRTDCRGPASRRQARMRRRLRCKPLLLGGRDHPRRGVDPHKLESSADAQAAIAAIRSGVTDAHGIQLSAVALVAPGRTSGTVRPRSSPTASGSPRQSGPARTAGVVRARLPAFGRARGAARRCVPPAPAGRSGRPREPRCAGRRAGGRRAARAGPRCRPRARPDAGRRRAAVRHPPCRRPTGRAAGGTRPAHRRPPAFWAHTCSGRCWPRPTRRSCVSLSPVTQ